MGHPPKKGHFFGGGSGALDEKDFGYVSGRNKLFLGSLTFDFFFNNLEKTSFFSNFPDKWGVIGLQRKGFFALTLRALAGQD